MDLHLIISADYSPEERLSTERPEVDDSFFFRLRDGNEGKNCPITIDNKLFKF